MTTADASPNAMPTEADVASVASPGNRAAETTRRTTRSWLADLLAVLLLVALCWLYNWRLLTADPRNQQSLVEGDFSGQFVAFAHYQAERLGAGEIPLWNPYSLGGSPFLADTQAAVFYPPRLVTVAILNLTGGSTPGRMYDALQKEMVAHMLVASLLMYLFIRRSLASQPYAVLAGLVGAITFAYGGYLTAYPQLQLAVMEAGVWLPLALVGLLEGTRRRQAPSYSLGGYVLAGLALGSSLLAGHPQTSLYLIYLSLAYLGWQVLVERRPWSVFVVGAAIFLAVGLGISAVQLLPGWEYLGHTTRDTLGFAARGNGFPLYDVLQILFPGLFSLWSPLYFGILGLMLVTYSGYRLKWNEWFWFLVAFAALLLSFGSQTIVFDVFYNLAPGFGLFRGQERAAYVFSVAMSVLAASGAADILADTHDNPLTRRYVLIYTGFAAAAASLSVAAFAEWLSAPGEAQARFEIAAFGLFSTVIGAGFLVNLATWRNRTWLNWRMVPLVGFLVFELFSFGRANPNLESRPALDRLGEPSVIGAVRADNEGVFRVDGAEGIRENYGALYGVQDIRGISPLRLASVDALLRLPNTARVWEVMAVRYVPTMNRELPVPSTITTRDGDLNVHRLETPRPFARLVYKTWIEPDDNTARGILSEPAFDSRNTTVLPAQPTLPDGSALNLPPETPEYLVEIRRSQPETITLWLDTPADAILNVALVHYPGWQATIDGQPAPVLRADTAMSAVGVPAGEHTVELRFEPQSFYVGATISGVMLVLCVLALAVVAVQTRLRGDINASV